MSDSLPRAPMLPSSWRVACPACERQTDIEDHDWRESASGWIEVLDAARYPVCEYCGLQFEISSVFVLEAEHE